MHRATREFIQARQPHCKYVVETKKVVLVGGGDRNSCYTNAHSRLDKSKSIRLVSGWVIEPFNVVTNSTEIVQHFWNATDDGYHFDSTFEPHAKRYDYVVDMDLLTYCQENDHKLTSHLASSLFYKNGLYQTVDENTDGSLAYAGIDILKTDLLYRTNLI